MTTVCSVEKLLLRERKLPAEQLALEHKPITSFPIGLDIKFYWLYVIT